MSVMSWARWQALTLVMCCFTAAATFMPKRTHNEHNADDSLEISYRAAATQYTPFSDWSIGGPQNILQTNFQTMLTLASDAAAQGSDLIVFPEYGLTSTNLGTNRSEFKRLCQVIPDPNDARVPCIEIFPQEHYQMMEYLSCMALELDMYVVVDLSELSLTTEPYRKNHHINDQKDEGIVQNQNKFRVSDGDGVPSQDEQAGLDSDSKFIHSTEEGDSEEEDFIAYNTQVVFDRTGAVVARYRKKHLFLEPSFEYGTEDDSTALFFTDFSVPFTLQVCFDIMYVSPGLANAVSVGVKDVAMSTAWIDGLPFLTAPQIFSSWSRGLGVNLVVSNLFNPSNGELGSGVFHGVSGTDPDYNYDAAHTEPVLIVSNVTTRVAGHIVKDFHQYENTSINTRIKHLMKWIKLVGGSLKEQEYFENGGFTHGENEEYSNHDVGEQIVSLLESFKKHAYSMHVNRVLKSILTDQRQVSEWERFLNRRTCNKSCRNVREWLSNSKKLQDHPATHKPNEKETNANKSNFETPPVLHTSKEYQYIIHENMSLYSSMILSPPGGLFSNLSQSVENCHLDTFCCSAEYTFSGELTQPGATYMLLSYNGTVSKGSGVYDMWTQVCAVVYCTSDDVMSCAGLDTPHKEYEDNFNLHMITGYFDTSYVYPSVFGLDFQLISTDLWMYETSNDTQVYDSLQSRSVLDNILTASLFGRWYALD